MKKNILLTLLICSVFLIGWNSHKWYSDLETQVISRDQAKTLNESWGDLVIYTPEESTSTYGTKNMLTVLAEIKPGEQIHPPHQHTAEEFMFIVEGEGTWSMNGEELPAKEGDVFYASPWDWHGLTNTGDETLSFFIVKWDNKGVPLPEK